MVGDDDCVVMAKGSLTNPMRFASNSAESTEKFSPTGKNQAKNRKTCIVIHGANPDGDMYVGDEEVDYWGACAM